MKCISLSSAQKELQLILRKVLCWSSRRLEYLLTTYWPVILLTTYIHDELFNNIDRHRQSTTIPFQGGAVLQSACSRTRNTIPWSLRVCTKKKCLVPTRPLMLHPFFFNCTKSIWWHGRSLVTKRFQNIRGQQHSLIVALVWWQEHHLPFSSNGSARPLTSSSYQRASML